jgi:hypothetical protein
VRSCVCMCMCVSLSMDKPSDKENLLRDRVCVSMSLCERGSVSVCHTFL